MTTNCEIDHRKCVSNFLKSRVHNLAEALQSHVIKEEHAEVTDYCGLTNIEETNVQIMRLLYHFESIIYNLVIEHSVMNLLANWL